MQIFYKAIAGAEKAPTQQYYIFILLMQKQQSYVYFYFISIISIVYITILLQ